MSNSKSVVSEAGQCSIPRGIGADPSTPGHLYVADQGNSRIVELSAWGSFVRAWGWGVRDGSEELQVCTSETGCQGGLRGSGAGELPGGSQGIAVDSKGDVYVTEARCCGTANRLQKFDLSGPEPAFEWMAGGEVNKTKVALREEQEAEEEPVTVTEAEENLCTLASGDECGAGTAGTGQGQFGSNPPVGSLIAVDRNGTETATDDVLFVGDVDRIQKFDAEGAYLGEIALPEAGTVDSLAVDQASGDLYFAYASPIIRDESEVTVAEKPDVHRLDPHTGESVGKPLEVGIPTAIATDAAGSVYVADDRASDTSSKENPGEHSTRILVFDSAGNPLETIGEVDIREFGADEYEFNASTGIAAGSACLAESTDVYLANSSSANSFVRAWGPPPDDPGCPPERRAPSIEVSYATSVGTEEAQLEARINPHFWAGAQGTTRYYVQYATAACIEAQGWEGECVEEHPAPPGTELEGGVLDAGLPAPTLLSGLTPDTAYRFRFAAESRDSKKEPEPTVPGQPVFGVGGVPGEDGAERSFVTFPVPGAHAACPNDAFRTGPAAALPDCRAYELVSPLDKANGEIVTQLGTGTSGDPARHIQAAVSGEALTYSSYRAFADPVGAPYSSQYIARRDSDSWATENVSPRQEGPELASLLGIANPYRHFSAELTEGWVTTVTDPDPPLAPGAQPGYANIYRREGGGYEACTTEAPPVTTPENYIPVLQGVAAGGSVAVFRADGKLTPEASDAAVPDTFGSGVQGIEQLYACIDEGGGPRELALASVLPAGAASDQPSTAGAGGAADHYGRSARLAGALSADGSRLYFNAGGRLYLRENPAEEQSAQEHGAAWGEGDTIGPAKGEGRTFSTSTTIRQVKEEVGGFAVGQEIEGECIAAGTKITEVIEAQPEPNVFVGDKLVVDRNPTANCTETEIVGVASATASDVSADFGAFGSGQRIEGEWIASGTTIAEAKGAEAKLVLSAPATRTESGAAGTGDLSEGSPEIANVAVSEGPFRVGQLIHGAGIPPRARITEIDEPEEALALRISAPAKASATGVALSAAAPLEAFSECTEPARGCTYPVSPPGPNAGFWAAAPDGSAALFTQGGSLYRFDAASGEADEIAKGVKGLAGWSEDLSRAYLASTELLTGEGPGEANSEGRFPAPEELNLYLYESGAGGSFAFVGTLAASDGDSAKLAPINAKPSHRTARAGADGARLAFTSAARLTGYDNTDRLTGEPATEVYLYDAEAERLLCASCNPSGARPAAREVDRSRFISGGGAPILAAAHLPPWANSFHATRALSDDGSRLFFNAHDALSLGDTNGHQDVYQWEEPGTGSCTEATDTYSEQNGGCIEPISSGRGSSDSEFFDADRTGTDVFFATARSLLPQDPGLVDVYDAREGGGFPAPSEAPSCEGEACQGPASAPEDPTPASATFRGAGNVVSAPAAKKKAKPAKRRCARGKVRRRGGRCVRAHRKRAAKHHRPAHRHRRRAAR